MKRICGLVLQCICVVKLTTIELFISDTMYLMYVDESGDVGPLPGSPTRYFILSAIIVHESSWQNLLDDIIALRRFFKAKHGLLLKEEIHASEWLQKRIKLRAGIPRNVRFDILKKCLEWLKSRTDVSVITIRVDKQGRPDPFEYAWRLLIQRFDNTLAHRNFPGPGTGADKGMIICDNTDGNKLRKLLREMRRYNQVNNMVSIGPGARNIPLRAIVEDPVFRNSGDSFLLQLVDVVAYFARQIYEPNKYIRQKGGRLAYGRIEPIVNKFVTNYATNFKIVEV